MTRSMPRLELRGDERVLWQRQGSQAMLLQEFNWKREVIQSAEPVLVDFWATWCPPCRSMNPVIESLARDFKVCQVNVDNNQPLAAHYNVSSIPALFIFHGGKVV